jgi:hypothetical protein
LRLACSNIFFRLSGWKYFDLIPVGQLVTRSVSDIESIARIFSSVIYDYQWQWKWVVIKHFHVFVCSAKTTWIVIALSRRFWSLKPAGNMFKAQMQVALRMCETVYKHE